MVIAKYWSVFVYFLSTDFGERARMVEYYSRCLGQRSAGEGIFWIQTRRANRYLSPYEKQKHRHFIPNTTNGDNSETADTIKKCKTV